MMPRDGGSDEVMTDLRAMAAELERRFAGYKQRLAERNDGSAHAADDDAGIGGGEEEAEPDGGGDSGDDVRPGRMYEAYARRRDERLRQGWRARMERKEAEVKAFWAQLDLSGRAAGGNNGGAAGTAAGDEEAKTERNGDDDDKRRGSDAALAPRRRISGKKHARTRSFSSSSTNTGRNRPDVGRRRALSQEPPPSEPRDGAGDGSKETSRARPAGAAAAATTTTLTLRPKTSSLRRKNTVKKGHGSAKASKQTGPKLPRSLPRRGSSGGLEDLSEEAVLPSADAVVEPVLRGSFELQDVDDGETPKASPPRPSTSIGVGAAAAAGNDQSASADSDRSEVVNPVPEGEPEAQDAAVKKRRDKEVDTSSHPNKLIGNPNGEMITSDSDDIESSYIYTTNNDIVEENAESLPETRPAASVVAAAEISLKTNDDEDNTEKTTEQAGVTTTEIVTTGNEEAAPARESSGGNSSFSGSSRLGRSPPTPSASSTAAPSCSSRDDRSIERVLEADAAFLRKKRAERSTPKKTPGSAGSSVSGAARSPKETPPRGFKRFLSFGKKNRSAREVTDCTTSPSASSSVAYDNSGEWPQPAGSIIKPRIMGSSDADTDQGHTTPPRAHRLFFSFRSLNCGRG